MGCNPSTERNTEGKKEGKTETKTGKAGYVIGFFDFINMPADMKKFKMEYGPKAEPTLIPYGGHFISKAPIDEKVAEKMGIPPADSFGSPGMMAFMLKFPSYEKAVAWYQGTEYAAVLEQRDSITKFRMCCAEGEDIKAGEGLVMGFVDLLKPKEFKEDYQPVAVPTLKNYEGKFALKAPLKGKEKESFGKPGMLGFCLKFPSFEKAKGWFNGPEYAKVLKLRDEVAAFRMAVIPAKEFPAPK